MFSHPKNAFDMKAAFDSGKVVLINTAKDVLKAEASAIFGRYMIALAMQAALERAADPEASRRPAFLYIDEAADYFDQNIDTLLIQARKYKVGITRGKGRELPAHPPPQCRRDRPQCTAGAAPRIHVFLVCVRRGRDVAARSAAAPSQRCANEPAPQHRCCAV